MVDDDRAGHPGDAEHVGPRFEPAPPAGGASSRVPGFAGVDARRDAPLTKEGRRRPTPPPEPIPEHPLLDPDRRDRKPRKLTVALVGVLLVVLCIAAYAFLPHGSGKDADETYLEHLRAYGLSQQFRSDEAALASAHRFCRGLEAGRPRIGYQRDYVAVQDLCPSFEQGFKVRQTPSQMATALDAQLDSAGQGDAFRSTADAVRRAEALCRELRRGNDQKGTAADRIAVLVYCPEKLFRFHEFRKTTALGTFTLRAGKVDPAAPPVTTEGTLCTGANAYADFHLGTKVTVTTGQGEPLGVTRLRSGHGGSTECVFTFAVELTEGEDAYVFAIGDLPPASFSFEEALMGKIRMDLRTS